MGKGGGDRYGGDAKIAGEVGGIEVDAEGRGLLIRWSREAPELGEAVAVAMGLDEGAAEVEAREGLGTAEVEVEEDGRVCLSRVAFLRGSLGGFDGGQLERADSGGCGDVGQGVRLDGGDHGGEDLANVDETSNLVLPQFDLRGAVLKLRPEPLDELPVPRHGGGRAHHVRRAKYDAPRPLEQPPLERRLRAPVRVHRPRLLDRAPRRLDSDPPVPVRLLAPAQHDVRRQLNQQRVGDRGEHRLQQLQRTVRRLRLRRGRLARSGRRHRRRVHHHVRQHAPQRCRRARRLADLQPHARHPSHRPRRRLAPV
mmetsp:Transcript_530/g.1557  ORF Transcript_530/g.1557 Transcript_530/m.1557 type:complete len:311 (+) Transcript_530:799-1731(+)